MQKLDRETKILIYISLFITGSLIFFLSSMVISAIVLGILALYDFELTEQLIIKVLIPSAIIGSILSYYLMRMRYRIFKDRNNFY